MPHDATSPKESECRCDSGMVCRVIYILHTHTHNDIITLIDLKVLGKFEMV